MAEGGVDDCCISSYSLFGAGASIGEVAIRPGDDSFDGHDALLLDRLAKAPARAAWIEARGDSRRLLLVPIVPRDSRRLSLLPARA